MGTVNFMLDRSGYRHIPWVPVFTGNKWYWVYHGKLLAKRQDFEVQQGAALE